MICCGYTFVCLVVYLSLHRKAKNAHFFSSTFAGYLVVAAFQQRENRVELRFAFFRLVFPCFITFPISLFGLLYVVFDSTCLLFPPTVSFFARQINRLSMRVVSKLLYYVCFYGPAEWPEILCYEGAGGCSFWAMLPELSERVKNRAFLKRFRIMVVGRSRWEIKVEGGIWYDLWAEEVDEEKCDEKVIWYWEAITLKFLFKCSIVIKTQRNEIYGG